MDDHEFSMDSEPTVKPKVSTPVSTITHAVVVSPREEMFSKLNVLCNMQIHLKNELGVVTKQIEVMEKLIETDYSN